jgi:hypothetical protein
MIELRAAVVSGKPIIALLEPDNLHGSTSRQEMIDYLHGVDARYEKWGLSPEPTGAALAAALFAEEPVEMSRIGAFQHVTLRLIAQRLLPHACDVNERDCSRESETYTHAAGRDVPRMRVLPLPAGVRFHVYCSQHSPGCAELVDELIASHGLQHLQVTSRAQDAPLCACFLIYLNRHTWTCSSSAALAAEVEQLLMSGMKPLLVHEQPGDGGQRERGGVEFASFFETTPQTLIDRRLYSDIAVPLKGGALRPTSLTLLANALLSVSSDLQARSTMQLALHHAPSLVMEMARRRLRHLFNGRGGLGARLEDEYATELQDLSQEPSSSAKARACAWSARSHSGPMIPTGEA